MSELEFTQHEIDEAVRRYMENGGKHVAMVTFTRGDTAADVDNNGTASFLHLPAGKFVVTNHHVYDQFRQQRSVDPTCRIALTGTGLCRPYDISDAELVSENERLDLCVLKVDERVVEAMGKQFVEFRNWPPRSANDGENMIFIGFPGVRRTVESLDHPENGGSIDVLRHEAIVLCPTKEGTSDTGIRMAFTNPTTTIATFSAPPIGEFPWGGMSGSLVYRLDRETNKFLPCAILREAGESLQSPFYATNLNSIASDGSIIEPQ